MLKKAWTTGDCICPGEGLLHMSRGGWTEIVQRGSQVYCIHLWGGVDCVEVEEGSRSTGYFVHFFMAKGSWRMILRHQEKFAKIMHSQQMTSKGFSTVDG